MTRIIAILIIVFLASCSSHEKWSVKSPDGKLEVRVHMDSLNTLNYTVYLEDKVVTGPSRLGIALDSGGYSFLQDLDFAGQTEDRIHDEYIAVSGKRKANIYDGNEKIYSFRHVSDKQIDIIFRVSNHSVAFRYQLHNPDSVKVDQEVSEFNLPAGSLAWIQHFAGPWNDYEMFYTKRLLDTMNKPAYYMPGLFLTPEKQWVFISDADVTGDYAAGQLTHHGDGKLALKIPDKPVEIPQGLEDTWYSVVHAESPDVHVPQNMSTPWRVMIISDDLGDIVESNILENLSRPAEIENPDWIEPGVAVFPWWGNSIANDDPDILRDYIDLAAEMNWEYIEFDIGLIGNNGGYAANFWRDIDYIPEVIDYASSKGIKVYGWDERRHLDTREERDDIFGTYRKWGVAGIKMDFINSDKQAAMRWYEEATAHAAEYHLLVSFHGAVTPRGLRRTFPNIMTFEGVRGAEYYKFASDNNIPTPEHNCTLPFTRNVSGPMDYTPTCFSTPRRTTTYAHELALPFVFESGWICMADKPEEFRKSPGRELLQNLEATWDDIHFIDGFPGEYCCLARRKGDQWFVAAINADKDRSIEILYDFISEGDYRARIYTDDGNNGLKITETSITKYMVQEYGLKSNGGFVIQLIKTSY